MVKAGPMKGIEVIDEYLNEVPYQQRQHCLFLYLKSQFYNQLNNTEKATEFSTKSWNCALIYDKARK